MLRKTWRESSQHFSQHDSSRGGVTKKRDSSRVIDSSHAITGVHWLGLLERHKTSFFQW